MTSDDGDGDGGDGDGYGGDDEEEEEDDEGDPQKRAFFGDLWKGVSILGDQVTTGRTGVSILPTQRTQYDQQITHRFAWFWSSHNGKLMITEEAAKNTPVNQYWLSKSTMF